MLQAYFIQPIPRITGFMLNASLMPRKVRQWRINTDHPKVDLSEWKQTGRLLRCDRVLGQKKGLKGKTYHLYLRNQPRLKYAVVEEVLEGFTVDNVVLGPFDFQVWFRTAAAQGFVFPCWVEIGGLYACNDVCQPCGESDGNLKLCKKTEEDTIQIWKLIAQNSTDNSL